MENINFSLPPPGVTLSDFYFLPKLIVLYEDICIVNEANKLNMLILPSSMISELALALLNKSSDKAEEIRHAAMVFHAEKLAMHQ